MSPGNPDDTHTHDPNFAAMWSSDGATRSFSSTRAIVVWAPAFVLCTLITEGASPQKASLGQTLLYTSIFAVFIAGAVWALLHPMRGIQDRIAGTWMVPR